MKKKTLLILLAGIVLAWTTVDAPSVVAGSPQQHRWEGVAIGVGAAIIGGTLFHHARRQRRHSRPMYTQAYPPQQQVYASQQRVYAAPACPPRQRRGHWEWHKTWVPPMHEKTWNPGHYNRRNRWKPGRWIMIETQPGYWSKQKVWVR